MNIEIGKTITLKEFRQLMSDGRQVWAYVDEFGNRRLYVLMSVESYMSAQQAAADGHSVSQEIKCAVSACSRDVEFYSPSHKKYFCTPHAFFFVSKYSDLEEIARR